MFTHLSTISITRKTELSWGANDRRSRVNHGQTCEKERRRWDIEHLQVLAWFSRLTVAGALERGSLTATWVSNIRNVALFVHPSSFMPSVLLICCYLCSSYFDSRPHDDVNARRHNDESHRLRSRIACGGNGSGLRYLPNRMKKRTHQAPHQGNERTSQDRSPARKAAFRSLPSSSLASIVSSLSRLLVEGNAEPLIEEGKKKPVAAQYTVMHQINIGALQIVHA